MPPFVTQVLAQIVNIIAALVVLLIGWLVARIISGAINKLVRRSRANDRVNGSLADAGVTQQPDSASWLATLVFWVIMIFVLLAFFQILNLTFAATVLSSMLAAVFEYLPRLFAGVALALAAWVVASLVRAIITRVLNALRVDERLTQQIAGEAAPAPAQTPVATAIGEIGYWLVWLLFLPAIIGVLGLVGLLGPVQSLVDKVLAFLPNLFAATVILIVGVFLARILRRIVSSLLASIGLDLLGARVGLSRESGSLTLSALIGLLVYVLVLIPAITAALNALGLSSLTAPLSQMLGQLVGALPNILAAVVIIAVGFVIGRLVGTLVTGLLRTIGFDTWLGRLGITTGEAESQMRLSQIAGQIVMVAIVIFSAMEASQMLGWTALTGLLASFLVLAGHILLGLIIIGLGIWLANVVAAAIAASGQRQARLLALVARIGILWLAGAMGLQQMGIADSIVNLAFGLILGAAAVAAALAFGLGGREIAGRELQTWVDAAKSDDKPVE